MASLESYTYLIFTSWVILKQTKTSNMSDEEEAMVKYSQNTFGSITEQQTELKEKQNKQK